jgi:hypothetical protein
MAQDEEMRRTLNAERRTPNTELPQIFSAFDVGRWTFGVRRLP